jgi:hypothetical protein
MNASAPLVRIATPTGRVSQGRGFYQLDEDILLVQLGPFLGDRQFFSSLESEHIRFDIDREGRLIGIECRLPRRQWLVAKEVVITPTIAEPADVRWLDFRTALPEPDILTNPSRSSLMIVFCADKSSPWYILGDSVLLQIDRQGQATALLVTGIEDDTAGHKLAEFRIHVNRSLGHKSSIVMPPQA